MYQFKFADIGEGIHEGQILKWMFKEGDQVKEGNILCVVETDKVNAELPSPVNGKIDKILAREGETIHVGQVFVEIDDGNVKENLPKIEPVTEGETNSSGVVGELEVSSLVIESSVEQTKIQTDKRKSKVLATPVARQMAKDLGLDITMIRGSGPLGRVLKEDIISAKKITNEIVEPRILQPPLEINGNVERVPLSKLRKTIAKNMVLSKSIIPHAATMDDYDVTRLVQFRKENKELALKHGINLTYMPFIIKAITLVLKEFPVFNSSYDHNKEELLLKRFYNIGIAVDTPDGLIVPVIKNADQKSIFNISKELEVLAKEARDRSLSLEKLQEGTFTITNYGAFGSSYGVPVIKHPEVAIIGIGKITKKPVVIDEEIVIRDMMPVSLCIDHRVIDGGDAGRFLLRLKEYLNDPFALLLS